MRAARLAQNRYAGDRRFGVRRSRPAGHGRRIHRALLVFLCVLSWASAGTALAAVNASLDRERIVKGETVTLVIQTNDPQQTLDPRLDALAEDFVLLDRRSETQMSIVNGQQSAVMRLLLTLEPRREGSLTIPPLQFGGETTSPLTLQVDPEPERAPGEPEPMFIELEIEPAEGPHYVHAQLLLTVRIFYVPNLTEAAITPPDPLNASVRMLDEVPFQADRGGVRYRVLERRYAVFPERSGVLEIPPMRLTGRLVDRRSDRLWQPSVRGRRVEAASESLALDIEPRPVEFAADHWLPARSIQISQTLSGEKQLKVGEPVTRTVIIDAVGLEENMLVEPTWPEVPGTRIYPDQPQGITRDDGNWVLGHKEFRYAVVPEQAGELVLPELRLAWWDTVNHRAQEAVLPAQRLEVLAAPVPEAPAPGQVDAPAGNEPAAVDPGTGSALSSTGARLWQALAGLFGLLWLLTLAGWLWSRRASTRPAEAQPQAALEQAALLEQFQKACREGRRGDARLALLRWQRRFAPDGMRGNLRELVRSSGDEELASRVAELDAAGFRRSSADDWDGAALWQAFDRWRQAALRQERGNGRPNLDLYPAASRIASLVWLGLLLCPQPGWTQPDDALSTALAKADCPPSAYSYDSLMQLRAAGFTLDDPVERNDLALALLACVGDPDPRIRDGIVYESYASWLRADLLQADTREQLLVSLLAMLQAEDPDGLLGPFAALNLSEVARTDRIAAWLDEDPRQALVQAAAAYLGGVRDYRGFSDAEGWRHGVAHAADLALQLVLNSQVTADQAQALLAAVALQITPDGEVFYTFGEPARLLRPVLYGHARGDIPAEFWDQWFAGLLDPAPLDSWEEAWSSRVGLAQRHNLLAFLQAMYVSAGMAGDERSATLQQRAADALKLLAGP